MEIHNVLCCFKLENLCFVSALLMRILIQTQNRWQKKTTPFESGFKSFTRVAYSLIKRLVETPLLVDTSNKYIPDCNCAILIVSFSILPLPIV